MRLSIIVCTRKGPHKGFFVPLGRHDGDSPPYRQKPARFSPRFRPAKRPPYPLGSRNCDACAVARIEL
jgi:hypothetical protein